MSQEAQAKQDLILEQGADAQMPEVDEEAPESGPRIVEKARGNIQETAEAQELPSFDEVMIKVQNIEQGDNDTLNKLVNGEVGKPGLGSKIMKYVIRDPHGLNGKLGWHCKPQEKGPLTPEQSKALADAINNKIDGDKMHAATELKQTERGKKNVREEAEQETVNKEEAIDEEILKDLIGAIESARDFARMTDLMHYARREKFILVSREDGKWKIEPITGLKGSHEIAQAFNSKRVSLKEEQDRIAEARKKKMLDGIKRTVGEKETRGALKYLVADFYGRKRGIVRFTELEKGDWTVEPMEGVEGGEEIVKIILDRKKELNTALSRDRLNEILKNRRR